MRSARREDGPIVKSTSTTSVGMILLGIWLIVTGATPFLAITIPYRTVVMAILALVAGILIILGR